MLKNVKHSSNITRKLFHDIRRETSLLDLIHSDLCDFHSTPSFENKKYVVTYIDDCTRYNYVYLLYRKDEALDKFKIYKSEVKTEKGVLIKKDYKPIEVVNIMIQSIFNWLAYFVKSRLLIHLNKMVSWKRGLEC